MIPIDLIDDYLVDQEDGFKKLLTQSDVFSSAYGTFIIHSFSQLLEVNGWIKYMSL
jgi:hypothetical protein